MIDIHNHILPGLDDGAESWDDALEMAEMAVESGVQVIAATSHANLPETLYAGVNGTERREEAERYLMQLETFRGFLKQEKIPLKVCRGMEIFGPDQAAERLKRKELLTLNGTRYCLVEFALDTEAHPVYRTILELRAVGCIPVVAHPERYLCVQRVPAHVYEWYRMGAAIQVNKGSVTGRFGSRAERTADSLLRHRLVTAVASDAHSPYRRTPRMDEMKEILAARYGDHCPRLLLEENPARILLGKKVLWEKPVGYDYFS